MNSEGRDDPAEEAVRQQAADWWSALRVRDDDATKAAFAAWRANPEHAAAYDRLVRRWEQSAFAASSKAGQSRTLTRDPLPARRSGLFWGAIAAVALGVIMLSSFQFWRPLPRDDRRATSLAFSSGSEERQRIRLSDGSSVLLDKTSKIRVALTKDARRVWLDRGRARFDVAHDARRPFSVATAAGSVRARGTIFDVAVDGPGMRVALLRGSVEVRGAAAAAIHVRALRPGEQVIVRQGRPPAAPTRSVTVPDWTHGMIVFDATPVREAVARFNRTDGRRLIVADDVPETLRVTGAYRTDDPAGFAATLEVLFALRVHHDPDGIIRVSRG